MVKDIRKKGKKGIPTPPWLSKWKSKRKPQYPLSENKKAFLELQILFYLKENGVVAPSLLATEVLKVRIDNSNDICEDLIKHKLISIQKSGKRSFVYTKTEKGTKLCAKILSWISKEEMDDTGLKWVDLVLKLSNASYKDVEY